jgi:small subunit ribosomal protein S17
MKKRRQQKLGTVTGTKMQKTVVVTVERQVMHPLYKRVVRYTKKFLAHDEKNQCQQGDMVWIEETRPLSARKRWRVVEVVARAMPVGPASEGAA